MLGDVSTKTFRDRDESKKGEGDGDEDTGEEYHKPTLS